MALSKTGRFLSKAEILGVGVFSPLPSLSRVESEEGKRATTNVQNGLAFFFLFSFGLFSSL